MLEVWFSCSDFFYQSELNKLNACWDNVYRKVSGFQLSISVSKRVHRRSKQVELLPSLDTSSGLKAAWKTNKRIGQAWQKARRLLCGHLFLLYGSKTSVSIMWVKTICWLAPACLPSVSIVWVKTICFYCERQKHLPKTNAPPCRGTWWRIGWGDYSQPEGRGFASRSSRHVGTLGKSFTCSCLCASAWNSDTVSVL